VSLPSGESRSGVEKLSGTVERVTFHSAETGWSVLRVAPFGAPEKRVTVTLHQVQAFAGATMDFFGGWKQHPRYGEQFECRSAVLRKPATAAGLEKYLGSGLITGVGPRMARRIVKHFGDRSLEVLEGEVERLLEVRGIARRRLEQIAGAWREHRAIRDVVLFLQENGISTHFAVKIYRAYGDAAIARVKEDPFQLARDIYGIGFFSADRIARSLGFDPAGRPRIEAGIRHVLAASREQGHCFLTAEQVHAQASALLRSARRDEGVDEGGHGGDASGAGDGDGVAALVRPALDDLVARGEIRARLLPVQQAAAGSASSDAAGPRGEIACYYSRSLYHDEAALARQVARRARRRVAIDTVRATRWLDAWCARSSLELSAEQRAAVLGSAERAFSILTGGPGCGKTTTTRALVRLALAMGRRVTLAAPTGRAAQRMSQVVGLEAKTIHRLLEWSPLDGRFTRNAKSPLAADLLVVDETSMLDVSLGAALLDAVAEPAQVLFVGDPGQLPAVGAGDVLADLLRSPAVPRFELRRVFRQAERSAIVRFAHAIQRGERPEIPSPIARPEVWDEGTDCLFLDAEEASAEQARFVRRAGALVRRTLDDRQERALESGGERIGRLRAGAEGGRVEVAPVEGSEDSLEVFSIPERFLHVDLARLSPEAPLAAQLRHVLARVHPHSVLRHGLTLADAVVRLYTQTLPRRLGAGTEVQILTPMNRGSAGAVELNRRIQQAVRPPSPGGAELVLGERALRPGDRVIQLRNNYHLGIFNGDIGEIVSVDPRGPGCEVAFGPAERRERVVSYGPSDLAEIALAYAITVHKSQGSEFDAVIIPLVAQHHRMLFRGLVYTALTRATRLAVFVGERRALGLAIRNQSAERRQTALAHLIDKG
jgi:exodeoxyribonuclease V alpha subunit